MKIDVRALMGITPRMESNLLDATDAQQAINCKAETGGLRPWRESSLYSNLTESSIQALFEYEGSLIIDEDDVDYALSAIANDPYSRLYFTGKTEPRVYSSSVALPGYYKLGVPAPDVTPLTEAVSLGTGADEQRIYAYTRLNSHYEEGPPSPITALPGTPYKDDSEVKLTKIEAIPSDRLITTLRLYRTVSGATNRAVFEKVKDFTLPTVTVFESGVTTAALDSYYSFDDGSENIIYKCIVGTTADPNDVVNGVDGSGADHWEHYELVDDVDTADMTSGTTCPSSDYFPPPTGLEDITAMPNGIYVGFVGNTLYFSKPYLAHAWPDLTETLHYQIVALGLVGSTLVALTTGKHSLLTGDSPGTMNHDPLDAFYPCKSKRSVVSAEMGVLFTSTDGLIIIDLNGIRNLTTGKMAKDDWTDVRPNLINGSFYGNKYFGFSTDVTTGLSFVYDFTMGTMTTMSSKVWASYVSEGDADLYIVVTENTTPNDPTSAEILKIKKWEGDTVNFKRFFWLSKRFILDDIVNFSVVRVILDNVFYASIVSQADDDDYLITLNDALFSSGDLLGEVDEQELNELEPNGDMLYSIESSFLSPDVEFKLFFDGKTTASATKTFSQSGVSKLPLGCSGQQLEFSVSGITPVLRVTIATSMREL